MPPTPAPQVFLSSTRSDADGVEHLVRALDHRGVTAFHEDDADARALVTERTLRALDGCALLVAVYSRHYPGGHARQWELTRAVLAAARLGEVRDRVLLVNPEPDDEHVVPAGVADVRSASLATSADAGRIADVVVEKLRRTGGIPLGAPGEVDVHPLLTQPARFTGEFRQVWELHDALRDRGNHAAVRVVGPAGAGKTALARQYAFLFREAYPGGVEVVDLAGAAVDDAVEDAVTRVATAVRRAAFDRFGLELAELPPAQAIGAYGDRLASDGVRALWVLDNVPAGVADLDAVLIPSPLAASIVTTRDSAAGGLRLEGPGSADPSTSIRSCSEHATAVLTFAAALAPAPISGELLAAGVAPEFGAATALLVAKGLSELEDRNLLHRAERTRGGRQTWRLPTLVADAVTPDAAVRRRAVVVVGSALATPDESVLRHARHVAEHAAAPAAPRLALLRAIAGLRERQGDLCAAHDARAAVLAVRGAQTPSPDLLAAARAAVAAERTTEALLLAEPLIARARAERDVRTEFRARLLAATSHDRLGDRARADELFHDHPVVDREGACPIWLPADERVDVLIARVTALRLRGEHRHALCTLNAHLLPIARKPPHPRGAWPRVTVERAALQLLCGSVLAARDTARSALDAFTAAGTPRHRLARQAALVRAEAELALAWAGSRVRQDQWQQATGHVRAALQETSAWYGDEHPLTLELRLLHARALHLNADPLGARRVLDPTADRAATALGAEHPLSLRAHLWQALTWVATEHWDTATALLADLLPRQSRAVGRNHPDAQLTRFHLGLCLLRTGDGDRARPLLTESRKVLLDLRGPGEPWAALARTTRVRVPRVTRLVHAVDDALRRRRG
ncbi:TIR domain-containing protein [Actinokineospora bangkokensis]|uniref:TIR domain-containing protein n=1 Tax=Actinokineospora bangkokensis TaxID=1193682 RepID=A0A1Q9LLV6_9PSEU|nr:TIR domain-containing protein [Actinokineospora bangkokensis]OLR93018.1 hypothetical protein BJP25_18840 [Actinokineospora bangkokensis]